MSAKKTRRQFNKVGCPIVPPNPTRDEIVQFLKDSALWERIQPRGEKMNARDWAATCLEDAAGCIESA